MLSDWLTKKSVENKCGGNTSVLEKIWQMKFNYYLLCEGNFRRKHLFILVLFIHPSNFFVLRPYAGVRLFTCILSSEFCTIFLTIDNNKVFNYLGRTFWLLGNSLLVNHKVCVCWSWVSFARLWSCWLSTPGISELYSTSLTWVGVKLYAPRCTDSLVSRGLHRNRRVHWANNNIQFSDSFEQEMNYSLQLLKQ